MIFKVKRITKLEDRYSKSMGKLYCNVTYIKLYLFGLIPVWTYHKYRKTYLGEIKSDENCDLNKTDNDNQVITKHNYQEYLNSTVIVSVACRFYGFIHPEINKLIDFKNNIWYFQDESGDRWEWDDTTEDCEININKKNG